MVAFLSDDDPFVEEVCLWIARNAKVSPRARAIQTCQLLTGDKPGKATALVDEWLLPDDPLDILVTRANWPAASEALGEIIEAVLIDGEEGKVWRVSTLRAERKVLDKAGVHYTAG